MGDAVFNINKDTSDDTITLTEGAHISLNMNNLASGRAILQDDGTLILTDKLTNSKWGKLYIKNYLQYGEGAVTFSNGDISDIALEDITYSSLKTLSPLGDDYDIFRAQTSSTSMTAGEDYNGTFLSDWVTGTAEDDVINGAGGRDDLDGGAGNDIISGGAGNDWLSGGDGNDVITGDEGDDTIFGGAGADNLSGGAGNDTITGGADNDTLTGGAGNDTFSFLSNDGTNTITDAEAGDIIEFQSTNFADLTFSRTASSNDLTVTGSSTNAIVTDFFNGHTLDDITAKEKNEEENVEYLKEKLNQHEEKLSFSKF